MNVLIQLPLGFIAAVLISVLAYRAHSLSRSGAIAATLLGTIVFGLGGLGWAVLLVGFFISSSLLSRLFKSRKRRLDEKFSKSSRRDAEQVLANGGLSGLFVLLHLAFPAAIWPWVAFVGALAAANADTWATELGVLNPSPPRLITTFRPVESGASGGISVTGTFAALGGALFIGLLGLFFWPGATPGPGPNLARLFLIGLAGLGGSLVDSFLGATLQAIYHCPACDKETERHPLHSCGAPTTLKRGLPWLDNDWVNAVCTLSGALLAILLATLVPTPPAIPALNPPATLSLTSPAFAYGQPIPAQYTCSGANQSPALRWSGFPTDARSLALVVTDPDAPFGSFTHWVIYNLPPTLNELPEAVVPSAQGFNDFGKTGYGGPCPPSGKPHRYFFRLYALDLEPNLPAGLRAKQLVQRMEGHILATGEWMGTFGR